MSDLPDDSEDIDMREYTEGDEEDEYEDEHGHDETEMHDSADEDNDDFDPNSTIDSDITADPNLVWLDIDVDAKACDYMENLMRDHLTVAMLAVNGAYRPKKEN